MGNNLTQSTVNRPERVVPDPLRVWQDKRASLQDKLRLVEANRPSSRIRSRSIHSPGSFSSEAHSVNRGSVRTR